MKKTVMLEQDEVAQIIASHLVEKGYSIPDDVETTFFMDDELIVIVGLEE